MPARAAAPSIRCESFTAAPRPATRSTAASSCQRRRTPITSTSSSAASGRPDRVLGGGDRPRAEPGRGVEHALEVGGGELVVVGEVERADQIGAGLEQRRVELGRPGDAAEREHADAVEPPVPRRDRRPGSATPASSARAPAASGPISTAARQRRAAASGRSRSGPAGSTRPLPKPTAPSTTSKEAVFSRLGFCSPSSMRSSSAPAATASRAVAARSAPTQVGASSGKRQRLVAHRRPPRPAAGSTRLPSRTRPP